MSNSRKTRPSTSSDKSDKEDEVEAMDISPSTSTAQTSRTVGQNTTRMASNLPSRPIRKNPETNKNLTRSGVRKPKPIITSSGGLSSSSSDPPLSFPVSSSASQPSSSSSTTPLNVPPPAKKPAELPYDPNQADNKNRLEIQEIINRLQDEKEIPTSKELERLKPPIQKWNYKPRIHPNAKKGHQGKLTDLNAARLVILDRFNVERRKPEKKPLTKEILGNPKLLSRNKETFDEVMKQKAKAGPNDITLPPSSPKKNSTRTYYSAQTGLYSSGGHTTSSSSPPASFTSPSSGSKSTGSNGSKKVVAVAEKTKGPIKFPKKTQARGAGGQFIKLQKDDTSQKPTVVVPGPYPGWEIIMPKQVEVSNTSPTLPAEEIEESLRVQDVEIIGATPFINIVELVQTEEENSNSEIKSPSKPPEKLMTTALKCDRMSAFAKLLTFKKKYKQSGKSYTWTVHRTQEQGSLFKFAWMPESPIRSLQYFSTSAAKKTLTAEEKQLIRVFNTHTKVLIFSIGLEAAYVAARMMEMEYDNLQKPVKLWHTDFFQKFADEMIASLKRGHRVGYYPAPSKGYMVKMHNDAVEKSIRNEVIFYDDSDLPEGFPTNTTFRLLARKLKTDYAPRPVLGTKLTYDDLGSLLPYYQHGLTFAVTEVIMQILCQKCLPTSYMQPTIDESINPTPLNKKGLKYVKLDLEIETKLENFSTIYGKSSLAYGELYKQKEIVRLDMFANKNEFDFITLVQFTPFKQKEPYEVLVFMRFHVRQITVWTTKQPSDCLIGDWDPFKHNHKRLFKPTNLVQQLEKLQKLMQNWFPDTTNAWSFKKSNNPSMSIFAVQKEMDNLEDGSELDNRLLLCKFVDYRVYVNQTKMTDWFVAKRIEKFRILPKKDNTNKAKTEQVVYPFKQLAKYAENYCVYKGEEKIAIPQDIILKLLEKGNLAQTMPYLKLRYLELIRNVMYS